MKDDANSIISNPDLGLPLNKEAIRKKYESGTYARILTLRDIANRLEQTCSVLVSHPTIKTRIKQFSSYYKKYINLLKTDGALPLITDLMGIRIVCPFIEDLLLVENLIKEHFEVTEVDRKEHSNTFKEFGYEAIHLLIRIPADIARVRGDTGTDVAEIQIRTVLQDAWAEVEHEIFYKAEFNPIDTPMKRKLAAVNASLTLADSVFQEIRDYQKKLNGQLGRRRESFYKKVESLDSMLFTDEPVPDISEPEEINVDHGSLSIDDLLLEALKAHNENRFADAIAVYSRILELKPDETICSLIYKHRGMANFAQSNYDDAILDFNKALVLDPKSYRVAYLRGVVRSVLKQFSEAIDDYTMSLEINPYQAFCLFRRGQSYFHIGDYPQALSDCEAALAMEPGNDAIQKFRILVQSKLKM
ncbi:MAG: tetratricopeptide repeat protein [Treponema sp.]|jgi:putative GTP pyrophosphokinase|nr:tetratricopeptide repeat protein [Treponema sp.]